MAITKLSNASFELGVATGLGGCITELAWRHPTLGSVDLMRRSSDAAIARKSVVQLASFPMVPFANRIDGGRIPMTTGVAIQLPINCRSQDVAIHGFSSTAPWTITSSEITRLHLVHEYCGQGNPFAYRAEQVFQICQDAVELCISVQNTSSTSLPFGLGLHPWFERTPLVELALRSSVAFQMDERDMPVEPIPFASLTGASRFSVAAVTPINTPLSGWDGVADIYWPEKQTALRLEAGGAFTIVHIFSPTDRNIFCVEPVSHIPDVVNRRSLAPYGDMVWLSPTETLTGHLRLQPATERFRH